MKKFARIPGIIGFLTDSRRFYSAGFSQCNELIFPGAKHALPDSSIRIITPFGLVGVLGRDAADSSKRGSIASSINYSVLIDGEYFSSEGTRKDSVWLLNQIDLRGISALDSLNGSYSLVLHDKRRNMVLLGSDRYSTRPLYYAVIKGALFFASDFSSLMQQIPSECPVNYGAIIDFISFEFILKNETFHHDIRVLSHGERLEWNDNGLASRRYWDYPAYLPSFPDADASKYLEGTYHAMRNAVRRRIEGKSTIGITLSSGLDSRSIAACVAELRNEPIQCYHLGELNHQNSLWAAEICRHLNGIFGSMALGKLEFNALIDATYNMLAGQFSINQAYVLWLLSSLEADDACVLDGQVQDTLLQFLYIALGPDSRARPVNYPEEILKFHQALPDDLIRIVLEDEWANRAISERYRRIEEHIQGRIFEDKSSLTQYFYYTARGQRYVWGGPVLEYSLVDVGYPGMDYDFFDWAMSLPIELRGPDAKLYRKMICTYFKNIAGIPWDATGAPLNIFIGRKTADYSLAGKDLWIHAIRRATFGKIDLSNVFLDKDKLFRNDRIFREAILDPLTAFDNASCIPISKKGVEKLIRMIMSGRNYFGLLQSVLTVMNFFKHFYERPQASQKVVL